MKAKQFTFKLKYEAVIKAIGFKGGEVGWTDYSEQIL